MAGTLIGRLNWEMTRDDDGYRDYKLEWLIESLVTDGPANVHLTAGLPLTGSGWSFGDDLDLQVWCRPNMTVRPVVTGEPNDLWIVEQTFSNRPIKRCQDTEVEDPLSEPPKVGGTFQKYRREARTDRNGDPLVSSSWEPIRGEIVEVEDPRPTVYIRRNVSSIDLATTTAILRNAPLNDATLWGVSARHLRFSNYTWDVNYYGTCSAYYTEHLEFEVDEFDRPYTDQGYMRLMTSAELGGTTPNPDNPKHFKLNTNNDGTPAWTLLNGAGVATSTPNDITLEILEESNLLLLGIPTSLV
jgi:hypothetical protein